jgi:hypothetical protein
VDTLSQTEPDFLTLHELGQRLRLGKTLLYELANRDELPIPVLRVGRQFRFSRHAYVELCRRQHDRHRDSDAA